MGFFCASKDHRRKNRIEAYVDEVKQVCKFSSKRVGRLGGDGWFLVNIYGLLVAGYYLKFARKERVASFKHQEYGKLAF